VPASRILQFQDRPGILDLSWGHPAPSSLPVRPWLAATEASMQRFGPAALGYGYWPGPAPLTEWIGQRLGQTDLRPATSADVFVTAGASHALDLVCALRTSPGDIVLVDTPTYHLAIETIADHDVEIVGVPLDDGFIDPLAVGDVVAAARRAGRRVRLLYLVPTFNNPTGRSLPLERRHALVELARRERITLVEDDTYREMSYAGPAPASLWSLAGDADVIRIGSFAKSVAPGIRLGFINANPDLVGTLSRLGYVNSGGGVNHAAALTMATFGASGAFAEHVKGLRTRYRAQRDALVDALREAVPSLAVPSPDGGWFIWLPLPPGMTAATLLPLAEAAGVSFLPGSMFYVRGDDDSHVRLSFSMLSPSELAVAGHRLGAVIAGQSRRRPG
jgi:2-aminoadipate transaminase